MKVIEVAEKANKENISKMFMSTFDAYGNPIEVTANEMDWRKFQKWVETKVIIGNKSIKDTLENRIMLINKIILEGKRIIYLGKPFEV